TVCSPAPFWSFKRKPSFSISKTDRSFFLIKSMTALMSLRSKCVGSVVEAGRLGNAVFPGRSSRLIAYDLAVPHLNPAGGRAGDLIAVRHNDQGGQRFAADLFQKLHHRR